MALPIIFSQVLGASSATAVVNAQGTTAALTAFTLATTILDVQRRLLLTFTGNESSNTFRVVGTNAAGNTIRETLTGTNATTAQSNLDFKTITSITPVSATVGTTSAGTNGVGSSLWQIVNWNADPSDIGFGVELRSGAANYTVQYTYDDPNNLLTGLVYPTPFNHSVVAAQTTTLDGVFAFPVVAIRLLTNSGTGTLWFRMLQAGLGSP
jgi:hypothetical protein